MDLFNLQARYLDFLRDCQGSEVAYSMRQRVLYEMNAASSTLANICARKFLGGGHER